MSRLFVFSIAIFISTAFFSTRTVAQNFELGLTVGLTSYNGDVDIDAKNLFSSMRPAVGIVGKYRLSNSFLLRAQALRGKLIGSEKTHSEEWRRDRGFSFETKITELSAVLEYDFMKRGRFNVFGFAGAGATFFNPKTDYALPNPYILTDVTVDNNTNYKTVTATIPMGLGVKYAMNRDFILSFEIGYRKVFTDYLDGISIIGNPNRKDAYFISALTLTKAFGGGKSAANRNFRMGSSNCPKID